MRWSVVLAGLFESAICLQYTLIRAATSLPDSRVVGFPGLAKMRAVSSSDGDQLACVGLIDRIASDLAVPIVKS